MSNQPYLPAYALIIAVNSGDLRAPELDAIKLHDTLKSMGITSINMLTGRAATRQNVIQNLHNIADNSCIPKDAPVIIYYAGHGIQRPINIPGIGSPKVEWIVPVDSFSRTSPALPIPDITISALVGRIARKKSNHITLFFDCCHAGSGSRVDETTELIPEIDQNDLAQLDQELWSEALEKPPPNEESNSRAAPRIIYPHSLRYPSITSHVLIASCHESQVSQEYRMRGAGTPQGLFTTALITALDDCKLDMVFWAVTHTALSERIKAIMQDIQHSNPGALPYPQAPQCEGYNKNRPIFSTPAFPHGSRAIAPLVGDPDSGICFIPIGSLAGVQPQTTFEIYDYPDGRRSSMGRYQATSSTDISEDRTRLNIGRLQLLPEAYAVMCTPPTALLLEMADSFLSLYNDRSFQDNLASQLDAGRAPLGHFINPVRSGASYKVRASYSRRRGSVELQNIHGGVLHIHNALQKTPEALAKAITFFHHLDQPNTSPMHNPNILDIWIHELVPTNVEVGRVEVILIPNQAQTPVPLRSTQESLIYGSNSPFGLQVMNRGPYHLFIYVFYFDPNDYLVTPLYLPPSSSVAPLPYNGELTIGYGSSGAQPLAFSIDDRLSQDTGFIKVYYSTVFSEMCFIQQDGFDEQRGSRSGDGCRWSTLPFGSITYPITVLNPNSRR